VQRGVQLPPEGEWRSGDGGFDSWLLDAGRPLRQALDEDFPIDWRREYLRRKKLRVLVVTYHTAHNNYYDLDTVRQLKKLGIDADICHLMCRHTPEEKAETENLYRFVDFDDNLFMKYDSIIYFAAMSGPDSIKKSLGDSFIEFLKSGGGIILCIYTHMKSYQLMSKWTETFYPAKPGGYHLLENQPNPSKFQSGRATRKGDGECTHPIMSGVNATRIDPTRLGSRFTGHIDERAEVVGEYDDGVPLAVVLNGAVNRAKGLEEEATSLSKMSEDDGDGGDCMVRSRASSLLRAEKQREWGSTVFLNFFPVTQDDPCTGGWYDWNSDIPLLLRNSVLFTARTGAYASKKDSPPSQAEAANQNM